MKKAKLVPVLLAFSLGFSNLTFAGVLGDADGNGYLTANDSAVALQYAVNSEVLSLTDEQLENADADKSGEISAYDAALILSKVLNAAYEFPDNSSSGDDSDTDTETTTEAETETTTEETTETTTEAYEGDYYILLADGDSRVYAYSDGAVGDELADQSAVTIDGDIINIEAAGTYYVEGSLSEGQLSVSSDLSKSESVAVYLMGVNVSNSTTAPFNGGGSKITVYLADGTTNTFTDSSSSAYTGYVTSAEPKGAFYSKRDLTIDESGTLVVNGNYSNGLVCGADLTIKGGANVTVNAVKNGIKGDNGVSFGKKAGKINVTTQTGDGIKSDAISSAKYYTSDGTKLSSKVSGIEADKGYVEIKGGTITITAGDDGIQTDNYFTMTAGTLDITSVAKGIKANEYQLYVVETGDDDNDYITYDSNGDIIYLNGTMSISGGTVTIDSGEDGLRASESLDISGGEIDITVGTGADGSTNDGIQAGTNTDTTSEASGGDTVTASENDGSGTITGRRGHKDRSGSTDDGIVSNGDFIMTDGTITGEADCDFFKVYENVEISGGSLDIVSGNDGIQAGKALETITDSDGNETENDSYTDGNITITGGTFNIAANEGISNSTITSETDPDSCKGIKATSNIDISGGTFTIDSADDCIHSNYNITITGGSFDLSTLDDGVHADYTLTLGSEDGEDDDFTIDIQTSYEGIEASVINMLSGTAYIYSTDDGINAAGYYDTDGTYYDDSSSDSSNSAGSSGSSGAMGPSSPGGWNGNMWGGGDQAADDSAPYGMLYIKGGCAYVYAPNGDGLDSNGSVEMSGGVVLVNGPGSSNTSNDVFDYGDDSSDYFKITGGTLIGAGYNMSSISLSLSGQGSASSSSSSQGGMGGPGGSSSGASSGSAGSPVKVTTNSGNIVFIPKVNWNYMYITTPDMSSGRSYTISSISSYSGGTQVLGVTENNTFYGLVENVN
ncbi:MAG: carbohydrate-binding domain-containing protein [Clostridiales bacterium]|nr:carbohydrate-binding domain-containing protein [Clostridiales bacterium]